MINKMGEEKKPLSEIDELVLKVRQIRERLEKDYSEENS